MGGWSYIHLVGWEVHHLEHVLVLLSCLAVVWCLAHSLWAAALLLRAHIAWDQVLACFGGAGQLLALCGIKQGKDNVESDLPFRS